MRIGKVLAAALVWPVVVAAETRTYVVDPARSVVSIHVGRTGLFGFAGHEHEVLAGSVAGEVAADPDDVTRSSVQVEFETGALRVSGKGEPGKDVPEVQDRMRGPDVLDVAHFPAVTFHSTGVTGQPRGARAWELVVSGELTLRGVSRPLRLPLHASLDAGVLTVTGTTVLRQTGFGMTPVSAGGGTVKVKDEIGVDYKFVATEKP